MPTIEIVSVDSKTLELNQDSFDLAIRVERVVMSHRGLFYDFLKKQNGTIVHIGNPDMKNEDRFFFAGSIIDYDVVDPKLELRKKGLKSNSKNSYSNQAFIFKFEERFQREIDTILKLAIENSPIKKVYFLTDYQFGPEKGKQEIIYSISKLWKRHDSEGLEYNTLYELYSY